MSEEELPVGAVPSARTPRTDPYPVHTILADALTLPPGRYPSSLRMIFSQEALKTSRQNLRARLTEEQAEQVRQALVASGWEQDKCRDTFKRRIEKLCVDIVFLRKIDGEGIMMRFRTEWNTQALRVAAFRFPNLSHRSLLGPPLKRHQDFLNWELALYHALEYDEVEDRVRFAGMTEEEADMAYTIIRALRRLTGLGIDGLRINRKTRVQPTGMMVAFRIRLYAIWMKMEALRTKLYPILRNAKQLLQLNRGLPAAKLRGILSPYNSNVREWDRNNTWAKGLGARLFNAHCRSAFGNLPPSRQMIRNHWELIYEPGPGTKSASILLKNISRLRKMDKKDNRTPLWSDETDILLDRAHRQMKLSIEDAETGKGCREGWRYIRG